MSVQIDRIRAFFEKITESPEGKEAITEYNHIYQFKMVDGKPFYVRIEDGKVSVHEGEIPYDWRKVMIIEIDSKTLKEIIEAKVHPTEAWFNGKLIVPYGRIGKIEYFAWIMRLMRIAQGFPHPLRK